MKLRVLIPLFVCLFLIAPAAADEAVEEREDALDFGADPLAPYGFGDSRLGGAGASAVWPNFGASIAPPSMGYGLARPVPGPGLRGPGTHMPGERPPTQPFGVGSYSGTPPGGFPTPGPGAAP